MVRSKNKKILYIMVGIAGAGKSTWIKNNVAKMDGYVKVVSRDKIRFRLVKENEEYFSKEKEVFNTFVEEIKDGLNNCDITIADATHISAGSRTKLLRALGAALKDIEVDAIVISPPAKKIKTQNASRVGRERVPETAINNMIKSFTFPTVEEGFDKIIEIRS